VNQAYLDFLRAKAVAAPQFGRGDEPGQANALLKGHQRAIVEWAVGGGRRAIFASFGLGKTLMQLETIRLTLNPDERGLIICPLGVRAEFAKDAAMLGAAATFVRTSAHVAGPGIYITNYESVREGKIDPALFTAISLDEAAILRGMGGTKTFREFMRLFEHTPFRFVATATPSPNDYIEFLSYAAFLGIMDIGEAKTRFFQRNSEKADELTILPHKEDEFWAWVASWAVVILRPSDLGFSDEGYELPALDVKWHCVTPAVDDHGTEYDGQGKLLRDASLGVQQAAAEKRLSLPARVAEVGRLVDSRPGDHVIVWHDLESERHAITSSIEGIEAVYGSQDLDEREDLVAAFAEGRLARLAAKPVMLGAGCNLQRHCHWAIFAGIGFKFRDFIQAIHRIHRFLQPQQVTIDIIYSDAEAEIVRDLQAKWRRHDAMMERMSALMRECGLGGELARARLQRSIGCERKEERGKQFVAVLNDCVDETTAMPDASVDLIITSIPFGTQYEYTPSYNDFGHTDDDEHFFRQMDFLSPQLLRVLQPGRVMAVHVKDRIRPGSLDGLGFQTASPFHAECILHYRRHGFAYLGMITVVTDVVRENNQTYRLGYSEQCKDGSRMGVGMPEYVLLFRKPPTDASNGYADHRVVKSKSEYSRARWQVDAHALWRSSGERLIGTEELVGLPAEQVFKRYRAMSFATVYDHERHIAIGEALERAKQLPPGFMLLQPQSHDEDVWSDVTRMRTLNGAQEAAGREKHLCPLQFDIVDRLIARYSNPDELVMDPFGGLMTVPLRAIEMGRRGLGIELAPPYFADGVQYLRAAEEKISMPTLFDFLDEAAA
jgi:DNA modification methylase